MPEERGMEMDEYIKKETAYRAIMGERPEAREPSWFAELVLEIPAEDVVEVVHCRDCKHWHKIESSLIGETMCCTAQGCMNVRKEPDDFCSYGERKEGSD